MFWFNSSLMNHSTLIFLAFSNLLLILYAIYLSFPISCSIMSFSHLIFLQKSVNSLVLENSSHSSKLNMLLLYMRLSSASVLS